MSKDLLSAFNFIDRDDFVHRLDPRSKLFLVIVYMTLFILFGEYVVQIVLLATLIVWILIAHMGKQILDSLRGMAFILFFIIFFNTLFHSLNLGVRMSLRLINIIIAFSIFFQTTRPEDLTQAIAKFGISYPIAFSFSLAFRFIPTLAQEVETITKAQKSRGLVLQRGGLFQQIRNLFPLLIPLITNSIKRAYYVAESLEARSFGLIKHRTHLYPVKLKIYDWVVIVLLLFLLVAGIWFKVTGYCSETWLFLLEIPL
ncbi:MAG: energy-coupling factor transporter transmembrane protein EcfT [Candidatus Lokiarchaeota archaeon]|nr:energy-coupling factor transporter transmembrane protein EcfT [Candidatus Lokiarchaeota archaeon]